MLFSSLNHTLIAKHPSYPINPPHKTYCSLTFYFQHIYPPPYIHIYMPMPEIHTSVGLLHLQIYLFLPSQIMNALSTQSPLLPELLPLIHFMTLFQFHNSIHCNVHSQVFETSHFLQVFSFQTDSPTNVSLHS